MKISEEIKKKATLCENDFRCLKDIDSSSPKEDSCVNNVKFYISKELLFVKCSNIFCHYSLNFGGSIVCSCPVRKEIYNKYNI